MWLLPVTAADLDDLVTLDADPEVTRHITGGVATPRETYRDEVLPRWHAMAIAHPGRGFFAARRRSDGEFLGWFHLKPLDEAARELDVGYRLRRAAWGRGYATEGARFLVEHAFRTLGAEKILAHALAANTASCRVLQKAGLRFVRSYLEERFPGGAPAAQYALTRAEWEGGTG
jgi:RimJ/RimL family protein N-acetyltransferase